MKYGYVYAGIGVSIVAIGIFLIYLLETKENSDLTQQNQFSTIPKLSEDQAIQIVKSDLSKHLPNLNRTLIVGKDFLPFNPDYPKFPLRLIYVAPNGSQFYINSTNYSISHKCDYKDPNTVCLIRGNEKIEETSGKLVYVAEALWYTTTKVDSFADYFVDANNGDVLYSNLLQNIPSEINASEYKP